MTTRTLEVEIKGADISQLLARIQFEQVCLKRDHVYYSVNEQPDVCAWLIAQGIRGLSKSPESIIRETSNAVRKMTQTINEQLGDLPDTEPFAGRRMYTTVTNWDDAELAIKRMCDRWRELKREGVR